MKRTAAADSAGANGTKVARVDAGVARKTGERQRPAARPPPAPARARGPNPRAPPIRARGRAPSARSESTACARALRRAVTHLAPETAAAPRSLTSLISLTANSTSTSTPHPSQARASRS
jgi:hypothetical protein